MTDWLDQLVGEWTYEGHSVPDDPAQIRTGSETVTRRGAWVIIDGGDYRFQLAVDPETGRVVGDFVHWDYPRFWPYDGVIEDGVLHLGSRGPKFDGSEGETDYDDIFEVVSPDERRTIGRYVGADGQWVEFCTTTYRRKG